MGRHQQLLRLIITVWSVRPVAESASQYIEIEYNQELKPLEAVLSGVKQPVDFFICGTIEIPMPRVGRRPRNAVVSRARRTDRRPCAAGGTGALRPGASDERRFVRAQRMADLSRTGQNRREIMGANFENIVLKVKAGLGCEDASVCAEFYKLLVYDRGGFFLAHRDTEKTEGCSAPWS
jgi:hypothetical protein